MWQKPLRETVLKENPLDFAFFAWWEYGSSVP
jgi:hypothetical protein